MIRMGWKVPGWVLVTLVFVVPGCGGDGEPDENGELEAAAPDQEEVSAAPDPEEVSVTPDLEEVWATPEREDVSVAPTPLAAEPRASEGPEAGRAEDGEPSQAPPPPAGPLDAEPVTPADVPALAPPPPMVSQGTSLQLELRRDLSTRTHRVGDAFYARVVEEVLAQDGMVLIPEGTRVEGRVVESKKSEGAEDEALLKVQVESLILDGVEHPMTASVTEARIESGTQDSAGRTAATVATGTAAGALVGRILGGDRRGALTGAAAGAAAGTAVALATRDGHATMEAGTLLTVRLDEPLVLQAP